MNKTYWLTAIVITLLAYGLYPQTRVLAPDWGVYVVDEKDRPLSGIKVEQTSQDWTLEAKSHQITLITDAAGHVFFPQRRKNTCRGLIFFGALRNFARYAVHASFGPYDYVQALFPPGFGTTNIGEQEALWTGDQAHITSRLRIKHCPAGRWGLDCKFYAPSY